MKAVTNLSLKDQVAAILRREIACGNMADGEELTQESIATALAVSRIPVREAFLQLQSEGLLRRLPNRHVQVVGMTAERKRQNIRIQAGLEKEIAALLAASWNTEASIRLYDQMAQAEPDRVASLDEQFHLSFSKALDNPTLEQIHATCRRSLLPDPPPPEALLRLDAAIVDALKQRNLSALCHAIQTYHDAYMKEPKHESIDADQSSARP